MEDSRIINMARRALRMVNISLPYLSGLVAEIRLIPDRRIPFAGICASGRLLYNPDKMRDLSLEEMTFIFSHEVMHLMLRSHDRSTTEDHDIFNIAHDFVINDILENELGMVPPAGGLRLKNASAMSAEQLSQKIRENQDLYLSSWGKGLFHVKSDLAEKLSRAMGMEETHIKSYNSDVISEQEELKLFPDDQPEKVKERQNKLKILSSGSNSVKILKDTIDKQAGLQGHEEGYESSFAKALAGMYAPPWEMALQKWMDANEPGPRSFYRPSRRDSGCPNVIMPGRKREGWILHIIVDTSGSMTGTFPMILGKIASFCQSSGISTVHIVQADTEVTSDEIIGVEELQYFRINGYGGSDMNTAMESFSGDPEIQAAIVITDGCITYPERPVPYNVLWVLTEENSSFNPSYGSIINATIFPGSDQ
jgi:predicted metal-dependent peptidase